MKVSELIELLSDLDPDSEVKFRDDDGDFHDIGEAEGEVNIIDDPDDDEDDAGEGEQFVVLSK